MSKPIVSYSEANTVAGGTLISTRPSTRITADGRFTPSASENTEVTGIGSPVRRGSPMSASSLSSSELDSPARASVSGCFRRRVRRSLISGGTPDSGSFAKFSSLIGMEA